MKTILVFVISAFFLAPITAELKSEPRAGTDDYLRSIGYTDEQLSSGTGTEEREAFAFAQGIVVLQDPVGDVLNRFGATADMQVPWADLVDVSLEKKDKEGHWLVTFSLAEDLQGRPSGKANVLFYVDGDRDATNNAPDGIRAGMDREFSIEYTQELGWYADYRWYNAPEDFWATNVKTTMSFTSKNTLISFIIPFEELSGDLLPNWRAAIAVSDGTYTQVDVTPGIGFPSPVGETYPTGDFNATATRQASSWSFVILLVVAAMVLWDTLITLQKKE